MEIFEQIAKNQSTGKTENKRWCVSQFSDEYI